MNNAGTRDFPKRVRHLGAVMEKSLNQGSSLVSGRGMNNKTSTFIEDDAGLVALDEVRPALVQLAEVLVPYAGLAPADARNGGAL